jgi:MYXO-CTERM domain-containing protein
VTLPESDTRIGNVPRVWGLRHLGALFEELKLGGSAEIADEALDTASRFGIGTEFTFFTLNEASDTVMTYSQVPVDAVGELAVGTSSLLDGYTKTASYSQYVTADVRYMGDRAFPLQGGYYTDTSLGDRTDWVDLTYGSDLYFELAESDSYPGAAAYLSVGANVKFELMGLAFRVTSATWPLAETAGLPPQIDALPEPSFALASGPTTVTTTEVSVEPQVSEQRSDGKRPTLSGAGCACSTSGRAPSRGSAPAWIAAMLVFALRGVRRSAVGG